jgi:hypothetical protein
MKRIRALARVQSLWIGFWLLAGASGAVPITPTQLTVAASAGPLSDVIDVLGANAGSVSSDHEYDGGSLGHTSAVSRGQAGGESSLGAPPFAEALAEATAISLRPDIGGLTATAGAGGRFVYDVEITSVQPVDPTNPIPIFFTVSYAGQARLDGTVQGGSTGSARVAFAQLGGGTLFDEGVSVSASRRFDQFSGMQQFSVFPGASGALPGYRVFVTAGVSLQVGGNGSVQGEAIADPSFAFDQVAFDQYMAAVGLPTFALDEYWTFTYSPGYYPVPEPARLGLASLALCVLVGLRSRRGA